MRSLPPVSVPFLPFTVAGTDGACRQFCSDFYDGASMTAESVEGEDKSASSTFRSKAEALFDAIRRTDPSKLISVPVAEGSILESARLLGEEAVSESLPKLAESSLMKCLFEEFHKNFSKRSDVDGAPPSEDLALSSAPRVLKLEQALKVKRVPHLVKRKILLNHSSIPPASITPSADDLSASQGPSDTKVHKTSFLIRRSQLGESWSSPPLRRFFCPVSLRLWGSQGPQVSLCGRWLTKYLSGPSCLDWAGPFLIWPSRQCFPSGQPS